MWYIKAAIFEVHGIILIIVLLNGEFFGHILKFFWLSVIYKLILLSHHIKCILFPIKSKILQQKYFLLQYAFKRKRKIFHRQGGKNSQGEKEDLHCIHCKRNGSLDASTCKLPWDEIEQKRNQKKR